MAAGGYLEGIVELKDVTKVIIDEEKETRNDKDGQVQVNYPTQNLHSSLSETKKDEKDSIVNCLIQELESAVYETTNNIQDEKNDELNSRAHRPPCDLEGANAELKVVQETHRKLVAEKNALILALQSGTSMVKVKHSIMLNLFFIRQIFRVQ